ncbi:MAG: hypothetical protein JWN46_3328 [Acidimicrobiales bacterium]|nr:hypothetical protein [Acidimicrobiales bacterium]
MPTEEVRGRAQGVALLVLCMSVLVVGLDNAIVTIALPAFSRDLHASNSALQWIFDGYTLVFAGLLVTSGSIGDRFGRKTTLGVGLTIFAAGSAASAFAVSTLMLILSRAGMGVGASLILPSTLSLLTHVFPEPQRRARAIGVWAAVVGLGAAAGPVLGGLLLGRFWWGSVFLINVPIALVALVAGRFVLPDSKDPNSRGLDPLGALLSIAGLVAVVWAIIEAPTHGWSSPAIILSLAVGIAVFAAFLRWERACGQPMLDLSLFRSRRFSVANGTLTMCFFVMFGTQFLLTQYLQTVLGYSALQAGFRMLPFALTLLVMGPCAPRIVERVGTKLVVGTGALVVAAGVVVIRGVPVTDGYNHLVGGLVLLGLGMGLVIAPVTESVMGSLPHGKAGVGSAVNDTISQIGGVLGVAVLGSILAASYARGVDARLAELAAPATVIDRARGSIGGAVDAAASLADPLRPQVVAAARSEFVIAFSQTLLLAIAILVLAAILTLARLPARSDDSR